MRFDTGEWLKRAMDAYGESVWRLAYVMTRNRHVSEDVLQETFSKLYLSKKDFESGDHVENWLLKVAGNQCRSILRAKKRWRVVPYEQAIHDTPKIDESFCEIEESETLERAFAVLNEDEREILYLRVVEDKTTKEIARLLQCPHATVRTRLRRAKLKILKSFEGEGGLKGDEERGNRIG